MADSSSTTSSALAVPTTTPSLIFSTQSASSVVPPTNPLPSSSLSMGSFIYPPPLPLFTSSMAPSLSYSMPLVSPQLFPPLPTTVNIGNCFSSLMERDTYRAWKSQFLDVFAIQNLQHVIAGDARPPSPFIS